MNVNDPSKLLEKDPELMHFIEQQEETVRLNKVIDKLFTIIYNSNIDESIFLQTLQMTNDIINGNKLI